MTIIQSFTRWNWKRTFHIYNKEFSLKKMAISILKINLSLYTFYFIFLSIVRNIILESFLILRILTFNKMSTNFHFNIINYFIKEDIFLVKCTLELKSPEIKLHQIKKCNVSDDNNLLLWQLPCIPVSPKSPSEKLKIVISLKMKIKHNWCPIKYNCIYF